MDVSFSGWCSQGAGVAVHKVGASDIFLVFKFLFKFSSEGYILVILFPFCAREIEACTVIGLIVEQPRVQI